MQDFGQGDHQRRVAGHGAVVADPTVFVEDGEPIGRVYQGLLAAQALLLRLRLQKGALAQIDGRAPPVGEGGDQGPGSP